MPFPKSQICEHAVFSINVLNEWPVMILTSKSPENKNKYDEEKVLNAMQD